MSVCRNDSFADLFAVFYVCGVFNDNGTEVPVSAGDVLVTKSGDGHGIACAGSCPLELIALILFE